MRNFNWEAIPRQSVLGKSNVWTAQRPLEDFELDTKRIEELFSNSEQCHPPKDATSRKSVRGLPPTAQGAEVVAILNSKKSMNIGIFLKQFKRPTKDMVEDIRQGNLMKFGTGKLKELTKHLPEEGEVKKLLAFSGNLRHLCEADLFMVMLVKVPSYEARLHSLVLREEFSPLIEEIKQSIAVMTTAAKELLNCDDLHSIIHLVLKAGNYMNAGGYAGSAIGFRMTSLLKLVDTKANKPGMNLMHYVAMQAQEIDATLLKFPDQLQHIGAAARIQKVEVEMDFQREVEKVRKAKADASKEPDLQSQMESFLRRAESRLAGIEVSLQALNSVSHSVAEFYCEDPGAFKLEECCSIFHSFCEKFMRAVQENREREMAEAKRRQRERLQNAAKRRSVATCSTLDRDKDMEGVALESVLQGFLTTRGSRRKAGVPAPMGGSLTELATERTSSGEEETTGREVVRRRYSRAVEKHMNGWNSAQDLTGSCKQGEALPHKREDRRRSTGQERVPTVNEKQTPKGRDWRRSTCNFPSSAQTTASLVEEEEEEEEKGKENEEEVQKIREVTRRVLRYQSSRDSLLPGDSTADGSGQPSGAATSARKLDEPEEGFKQQPGREGQPRTILSPRLPPKTTPTGPNRRHTLSAPLTASPSDREASPVPAPPRVSPPPLAVIGKMKSLDSCLPSPPVEPQDQNTRTSSSLPDYPTQRTPSRGPTARPAPQEAGDPPPSFRLGDLFHRRSSQGSVRAARLERQGSSAFVSFFKRLGEKNSRSINEDLHS
ncbi:hypothetical protein MATL_G00049520 [Megalops atlanticus]|uniref:FH2 domain-containing protein n=1 Tax=Megalops atlanticus TaxID=7932 RepID=A0A9D3QA64_MEGAT|nr:hypothetical protein MATL_G00049520 [Megalops atlanticus]